MSVIPLKADIHQRGLRVRLVPLTDIDAPRADVERRRAAHIGGVAITCVGYY
jgi:hypothetical protein